MSIQIALQLALLQKPMTFDLAGPHDSGCLAQAVNAARLTGSACCTHQSYGLVEEVKESLKLLSLTPDELVCVDQGMICDVSFGRVDIICTDHPSQRGKHPQPASEGEESK